jgi:hypothetical protein
LTSLVFPHKINKEYISRLVSQIHCFVDLSRPHSMKKGRKFDENPGDQKDGNGNWDQGWQDEKKRTDLGHSVQRRKLSLFPAGFIRFLPPDGLLLARRLYETPLIITTKFLPTATYRPFKYSFFTEVKGSAFKTIKKVQYRVLNIVEDKS